MKTSGYRILVTAAVLTLPLVLGCSYYHDLYYERLNEEPVTIGRYQLRPRMFGYTDESASSYKITQQQLVISIRIGDDDVVRDIEEWQQDPESVALLAANFREEMNEQFVPDSLVLHFVGTEQPPVVLHHDPGNYSPRRDDFLTLQYGHHKLPGETSLVRTVLHVTRPEGADSAVWLMNRVDQSEKGLAVFRKEAKGY